MIASRLLLTYRGLGVWRRPKIIRKALKALHASDIAVAPRRPSKSEGQIQGAEGWPQHSLQVLV